jgi:hypothetical protein
VAMEHDVALLHRDRDFDPIAANCGLKVLTRRTGSGRGPTKSPHEESMKRRRATL